MRRNLSIAAGATRRSESSRTVTSVVPSLSTPAAMSRSRPFRVVTIWTTMPGVRKTARSRSTTPLALTITAARRRQGRGLAVHAKNAGVESEDQSAPGAGELVQIQGRAMEEVLEPVVAGRLLAQGAHDAGDAQQILASGESRQAEGHPQEGPGAGAGGAQFADQIPPVVPEHERPPCRLARRLGFRA